MPQDPDRGVSRYDGGGRAACVVTALWPERRIGLVSADDSSFDNPGCVDVVIHSYRHRLGLAPGYTQYADVEAKLAALRVITVPTVALDGEANGIIPTSDGQSSAAKFSGRRIQHRVPNAGHALP